MRSYVSSVTVLFELTAGQLSRAPYGRGSPGVDTVNDAFKRGSGFMMKSSEEEF